MMKLALWLVCSVGDDLASAKLNYLFAETLIIGPVFAFIWWRFIDYLPPVKLTFSNFFTSYPWNDFLMNNGTFFGLICLFVAARYSSKSESRIRRISKDYDLERLNPFILLFGGIGFLVTIFLLHVVVLVASDNVLVGLSDISKDFERTGTQGLWMFHPYGPGWVLTGGSLLVFGSRS